MKKSLILFTTLVTLAFIASCSSDTEEDVTPPDDPGDGAVTYAGSISTIISSNCLGCHSSPPVNGAPFSLTTFNDVSTRANGILNAISKQTGEPRAMPPGGRLSQSNIDLFQQWIDDGTPQN